MKHQFYLTALLLSLLLLLVACGGDPARQSAPQESDAAESEAEAAPVGDPVAGKEKFTATCAACHGPEGKGVPGLGKDMTTSEFIAGKNDAELIEFVKQGRDPSDPLNTTGVAMPVKGGNPTLTDEDLQDIVSFIRTIHE